MPGLSFWTKSALQQVAAAVLLNFQAPEGPLGAKVEFKLDRSTPGAIVDLPPAPIKFFDARSVALIAEGAFASYESSQGSPHVILKARPRDHSQHKSPGVFAGGPI